MFQIREKCKIPEEELNEMEISNLPDRLEVMIIKKPKEIREEWMNNVRSLKES